MKSKFKPFTTSLIGSMPRSRELLNLKRKLNAGDISLDEFETFVDNETRKIVDLQIETGIDVVTNGELSRDNYVSFVAEKLNGVVMMNMGDMLEYIDDKKAFEQILNTLDVPAISIKNAICNGNVSYDKKLVAEELAKLKEYKIPLKATLPGMYLMTRSMWLPKLSKNFYESKEKLGEDIIEVAKKEIDNLIEIGVDVIQFDEPVLTEVVFSEGKTRSFMCAALSEKKDPTEELEFATFLIKSVMDYLRKKEVLSALHICRGNWSRDESILLKGPYTPLLKLFEEVKPDILALEFSTPRAGEFETFLSNTELFKDTILGLGVINPRIDDIESSNSIIEKVESALKYVPKENIWLNPDCGFATFSNRPVNTLSIIEKKLVELNRAKEYLREKYV